jgi:hypothetical protein
MSSPHDLSALKVVSARNVILASFAAERSSRSVSRFPNSPTRYAASGHAEWSPKEVIHEALLSNLTPARANECRQGAAANNC